MMETELEAVKSFFCKMDEFNSRQDEYGTHVYINFDLSYNLASEFEDIARDDSSSGLSFCLDKDFPESRPQNIEVWCSLLNDSCLQTIKSNVEKMWSALGDETSLLELCCFAQDSIVRAVELKRTDESSRKQHASSGIINHSVGSHDQRTCQDVVHVAVPVPSYVLLDSEKLITEATTEPKSENRNFVSKCEDNQSKGKQIIYNNKCDGRPSMHEAGVEESFVGKGTNLGSDQDHSRVTALLQFDHMRSRQSYTKLIKKWVSELQLAGRLVFAQKDIFLLLQGHKDAIKEYIVRNRTCNVDVDSRGRGCKERMLSVLAEVPALGHQYLHDFSVLDDAHEKVDLPSLFVSYNMGSLYTDCLSQGSSRSRRKVAAKK